MASVSVRRLFNNGRQIARYFRFFIAAAGCLILYSVSLRAQSVVSGSEGYLRLRVAQLNGSTVSDPTGTVDQDRDSIPATGIFRRFKGWGMMQQPVYGSGFLDAETNPALEQQLFGFELPKSGFWVRLKPMESISYYNSTFPWGFNDAAVWQGRGLTQQFSAGVAFRAWVLEGQLRPEFLWNQNRAHDTTTVFLFNNGYWRSEQRRIDLPYKYPGGAFTTRVAGNTYLKLNVWRFHAGVSSAPMRLGPAMVHPMMLSNNAAGFNHFFAGTRAPLLTWLGSFEGLIFGGRLEESGQTAFPKEDQWRYVSGISVNWGVPFLPGLTMGGIRVFQTQQDDFDESLASYFPMFQTFLKKNIAAAQGDEGNDRSDQMAALVLRWVLPESRAEFYGEFSRSDHSYDLRDLFVQPEHAFGYMLGVQHDVLPSKTRHLVFLAEATRLERTNTWMSRANPGFYGHHIVTEGWTNRGQVLGAGIGPGSNARTMSATYLDQRSMLGLTLMQTMWNKSFYNAEPAFKNAERFDLWYDVSAGLNGSYRFGRVVVQGGLTYVLSRNRHYEKGNDVSNVNGMVGIRVGIQ